jgi:hypothetical protein
MSYPNTFEEYCKEIMEDLTGANVGPLDVIQKMVDTLHDFNYDEARGNLDEVLGLNGTDPKPVDYIEAAFRTLIMNLFDKTKYTPVNKPTWTVSIELSKEGKNSLDLLNIGQSIEEAIDRMADAAGTLMIDVPIRDMQWYCESKEEAEKVEQAIQKLGIPELTTCATYKDEVVTD